ncbi:MAG TPA: 4a-hydroxytetrahydrobiopterin dehydratase [Burkholderiaceae bacterium]|nr:4a-hydroxytetrahydrobiopterin dehydratase [Burkholderiaceae bacterium]
MNAALATRRCQPLEGQAPMSEADVERLLREVPGWALVAGAIEKTFRFADFHRTMAFVNAVAWIAHAEDHHPDVAFGYDRCTLRFNTHSVGGISINDFICAAKVDALHA